MLYTFHVTVGGRGLLVAAEDPSGAMIAARDYLKLNLGVEFVPDRDFTEIRRVDRLYGIYDPQI